MPIYTIDGNVGCGKSTVLDLLHARHGFAIDPEPVQRWRPFLDDIYQRRSGAFAFQARVWLDRCWIQEKPASHVVMERSPYFQANTFVPLNAESGHFAPAEQDVLRDMYDRAFRMWTPRGFVYLRSSPEACRSRVRTRGRPEEAGVTADYLRRLHAFHEAAYVTGVAHGLPIVCVDVEGKTPTAVAAEVAAALSAFGARPTAPPGPAPAPK